MPNMQVELHRTIRRRLTLTAQTRHAAAIWMVGMAPTEAKMQAAHLDLPPLAILTARTRFSCVDHDQPIDVSLPVQDVNYIDN